MSESASFLPKILPKIDGWPYENMCTEFETSLWRFGRKPSVMFVGHALWSLLIHNSEAGDFYVFDVIPVRLDVSGILEPHEFIFTLK